MNAAQKLPAVDQQVLVPLRPEQAFALFTRQMQAWWPFAGHSCSGQAGADVVFEPRVGGAVTELAPDGSRHAWGTLSEWNPPHAFAMSWHPGLPVEMSTLLRVSFTEHAGATQVRVLHSGWEARGAQAAEKRDQYNGGWPHTLQAFVAAAQKEMP
jgi:uncharacterized protein YndB with AHSA1/START domain